MDDRRELAFERIEEVMPEVERLIDGHTTTKAWTLAQILNHLSTSIRLSFAPEPLTPESSLDPDLARTYEVRRRRFFRSGRFPEGIEVPIEVLIPPVDADEHIEAESLRTGIRLLVTPEVSFIAHPILGPMSNQEWVDFHRMHCAHHLGFAKAAQPS
jgi:hypothetical protein